MATEFRLPNLGEGIASADVASLLVAEGAVITAEQNVMELETDKAVIELPSPHAGRITKLHVKPGDKLKVGDLLMTLEPADAEASTAPADTAPAAKAAAAPAPAKAAPAAASVAAAAATAPAAAAKATATPPATAPAAAPPAAAATALAPASASASATAPAAARPSLPATSGSNGQPPAPAGPATRRLARELGVDLYQVKGSGPGGRISIEDVQAFVRGALAGGPMVVLGGSGVMTAPPLPDFSQYGVIERVSQNKLSRVSAANLSLSWNLIPHVTQHEVVDVTDLEAGRKRLVASLANREGAPKVTMTVLAIKAVIAALKSFPNVNSSYDSAAGEVILKKYYNIGVAVDTEAGLVVPVIRNADQKSIIDIAAELTELSSKARARKLAISDMQGGTFTVTNLGGIGGSAFTPIVNYPEAAILGMSRSTMQPAVVNGEIVPRLLLPLSLSYDHRVINGAVAARFITRLSGLMADPFQLLSEI
jgi:pyruvate dehydrogenase E2 component (dihydrolipoamide acetyltransferase)